MATRSKKLVTFQRRSGNVFADLGVPNPERELPKASHRSKFTPQSRSSPEPNKKREKTWVSINARLRP